MQLGVVLLVTGLGLLFLSGRALFEIQEILLHRRVHGHRGRRRLPGLGGGGIRALAPARSARPAGPARLRGRRKSMRDLTLTEIERLRTEEADATVPLEMDEESFRGFYDRTARTLRAYLARVTGDGGARRRSAAGGLLPVPAGARQLRRGSPPAQHAVPDRHQPDSRQPPPRPGRAADRHLGARDRRSPRRGGPPPNGPPTCGAR